jgi:hypothetical protein
MHTQIKNKPTNPFHISNKNEKEKKSEKQNKITPFTYNKTRVKKQSTSKCRKETKFDERNEEKKQKRNPMGFESLIIGEQ